VTAKSPALHGLARQPFSRISTKASKSDLTAENAKDAKSQKTAPVLALKQVSAFLATLAVHSSIDVRRFG
jgi:hypothetical protein